MAHRLSYYLKVATSCFLLGMGMEMFMIKTGFYETVTRIEADRVAENWDEHQEKRKVFFTELIRQMEAKKLPLPPELKEFKKKEIDAKRERVFDEND